MHITDIENNELTISKFGQLIADSRHDDILVRFEYNNSPADVHISATGSATITNANSMAIISSGLGIGLGRLISKAIIVYRPAHEIHNYFTAAFTPDGDAGSFQRIGLFDGNNGFGLGYEGSVFGVFKRLAGVQTNYIQSAFNKNKLDGSKGNDENKKVYEIDFSKLNVFKISYGWLGGIPTSFTVYAGQDRGWIPFHVIDETKQSAVPTIASPSSHIQMECGRSASSGNTLSISTGSWNAGGTGERSTSGHRYFTQTFSKIIAAESQTYLGTISNISSYQSKTNKIPVYLTHIGASTDGTKSVKLTLLRNATLADPNYTDINTDSSVIQLDISGSASAGTEDMTFPMAKVDTLGEDLVEQKLRILPAETYTLVGDSFLSNTVEVTLRWREEHA